MLKHWYSVTENNDIGNADNIGRVNVDTMGIVKLMKLQKGMFNIWKYSMMILLKG